MKASTAVGLFLIFIGTVLFLTIQGLVSGEWFEILISWRSIVLIVAVLQITKDVRDKSAWLFFYFALLVNIPRFTHRDAMELFIVTVPVLLIFYGLYLISGRKSSEGQKQRKKLQEYAVSEMPEEFIFRNRDVSLIGKLADLRLLFILSNITIDLRETNTGDSGLYYIENTLILSSVTIIASNDMILNSRSIQFMAGHEGQRDNLFRSLSDDGKIIIELNSFNLASKLTLKYQ